ncbi:hypothetical protein [Actinokineospora inagensis]|uniref:hypothetical protein n=1 Tax=Actinokineospora inagensis TaxID=103730 RepID=UPI00041ED8F8|nr:hypothetical protein [Actinokineospora inagensis]
MSDDLGYTGDLDTTIPTDHRHRATRVVAATATDAADCALLLDMLGLTPESGLTHNEHRAA